MRICVPHSIPSQETHIVFRSSLCIIGPEGSGKTKIIHDNLEDLCMHGNIPHIWSSKKEYYPGVCANTILTIDDLKRLLGHDCANDPVQVMIVIDGIDEFLDEGLHPGFGQLCQRFIDGTGKLICTLRHPQKLPFHVNCYYKRSLGDHDTVISDGCLI